jgi:hypothetical protein
VFALRFSTREDGSETRGLFFVDDSLDEECCSEGDELWSLWLVEEEPEWE